MFILPATWLNNNICFAVSVIIYNNHSSNTCMMNLKYVCYTLGFVILPTDTHHNIHNGIRQCAQNRSTPHYIIMDDWFSRCLDQWFTSNNTRLFVWSSIPGAVLVNQYCNPLAEITLESISAQIEEITGKVKKCLREKNATHPSLRASQGQSARRNPENSIYYLMKSISQTCVARLMFSLFSDKSFQLNVDKINVLELHFLHFFIYFGLHWATTIALLLLKL